jgi:signal transduction histidine kinase
MLGVVLIGFATVFYFLARTHLYRQVDDRLASALNTLIAAVEIDADGVEWEPSERSLLFGRGPVGEELMWLICDEKGNIIDRSGILATDDFLRDAGGSRNEGEQASFRASYQGRDWQISRQWIQPGADQSRTRRQSAPARAGEPTKYPALVITVAVPLEPVQSTLRKTAGVLCGLSLAIWLLALFSGRLVCRRALIPVTRMAASARAMSPDDLTERLPMASTGDELEDLSRAFNNLLDRVEESFRRQERFTSDASHQLRTPLAAMLGQVEVALRRDRPSEEYVRVLSTVKQKTLHLQRIAESLLFLARADADAKPPEMEVLELRTWLNIPIQYWSESERARDIAWDGPDDEALGVRAHPVLLGELVNILVDNACKHSEAGTPIRITVRHDEEFVYLTIEDRGTGIADEDIPRLWEPFFRSEESRRRGVEGIGLGLSIAKRLAEALNGELSVASKVGQGSSFTLRMRKIETAQSSTLQGPLGYVGSFP